MPISNFGFSSQLEILAAVVFLHNQAWTFKRLDEKVRIKRKLDF